MDNASSYEVKFSKDIPEEIKKWFNTKRWKSPHEITSGNKVVALIDGDDTFESMVQAIRSAKDKSDFIYFANWRMELDFHLRPGRPWSTIKELLRQASKKKVEICGLLSNDLLGNYDEKNKNWTKEHERFFNELESTRVLPDKNFLPLGLHHQKILIVKSKDRYGIDRLVAFCGGVDISSDRLPEGLRHFERIGSSLAETKLETNKNGIRGGYHDVHCRIEGPATRQLLKLFCDRWIDNPNGYSGPLRGKDYLENTLTEPVVIGGADMFVQIGSTFGDGAVAGARKDSIINAIKQIMSSVGIIAKFKIVHEKIRPYFEKYKGQLFTKIEGSKGDRYSFAPNGDTSAYWMIVRAIEQARNYIYLEDQYLTATNLIAKKLNQALNDPNKPNLKIIIVISDSKITTDLFVPYRLRGDFIKALTANKNSSGYTYPNSRVSICYRKIEQDHNYMHSKVWICDDKYAIIGSANCNNRGYTHDSEVVAGIYDRKIEQSYSSQCNQQYNPKQDISFPSCPFAKELRIRLWKHHLNLETPKDAANQKQVNTIMDDSTRSLQYWFDLPHDAHVRRVPPEDVKYRENIDWKEFARNIAKSIQERKIVVPKSLVKLLVLATGQIDPRGDKKVS